MSDGGKTVLLFLFWLACFVLVCARGSFVDPQVAVKALDAQGYSNIQIVDHSWFAVGLRGCDTSDAARFTANATNPAGKQTQIYVCTGWIFKGATIRTK